MKPSVFASFLIFLYVGYKTITEYSFDTDEYVEFILILTIFSSAFYFYYLNIATEHTNHPRKRVRRKEIISWYITAVQYTCFYSLWIVLLMNYTYFTFLLLSINLSYLIWDILHYDIIQSDKRCKTMFYFDIGGIIISAGLFSVSLDMPPEIITGTVGAHQAIRISVIGSFYVALSVAGLIATIILFKYNPFQYFAMDGLPVIQSEESEEE